MSNQIKNRWNYKTLDDLKQTLENMNLHIPFSDDYLTLSKPLIIDKKTIHNRIVYQPMECGDSSHDGSPTERTIDRYKKFAAGGAGIIWVEAVAVLPEARSNPGQLYLHKDNLPAFQKLVEQVQSESQKINKRDAYIVIQLTHTGRYSHPEGSSAPVIAQHKPYIETNMKPNENDIISDNELKYFEEIMGKASALSEKAGFDAVEVKCCHGYLVSEMLTAYERPGLYGGSFENRTRLITNCLKSAQANTTSSFTITSRMNLYDGCPHPWGFGAKDDNTPDMKETLMLVDIMHKNGVKLLNLTSGSPFHFYMTCPKDISPEHPLKGISRMLMLTKEIKNANKDMKIVSSAYSYLRQYSPMAAAGSIVEEFSDLVGFGRMPFAYPNVANDIIANKFDIKQTCVCCEHCGYPCRVRGNSN